MSKPILVALGRVVHNYQALEYYLGVIAHVLIGHSDQRITKCITAELSFRGLVSLIAALHSEREPRRRIRAELTGLLKKASDLDARRNQLMHSVWSLDASGEQGTRLKATAKRELRWQVEPVVGADIEKVASDIASLSVALQAFMSAQGYAFSEASSDA